MFDIKNLQIFGSKVAVHIPNQLRQKWDSKSEIGIFVGYGENIKGYRIFFPIRNTVQVKRDVIFINEDKQKQENNIQESDTELKLVEVENNNTTNLEDCEKEGEVKNLEDCEKEEEEVNNLEDCEKEAKEVDKIEIDGRRKKKHPRWLDDYETSFLSINNEPLSYQEAIEGEDRENWLDAIQTEMNTLKENNTWTEVANSPKDVEIVSSKWVFKIKENKDGKKQYKARLVARGFKQTDCDL